jgi:hypothetical protein
MTYLDEDELPNLAPEAPWRTDKRLQRAAVKSAKPGEVVETYYTIGALASALGKEPVTIRRWIRLKVIPEAPYITPPIIGTRGDAGLRVWKEEQIVLIVLVAHECGLLGRRPQSLDKSNFESVLKQRWQEHGWPL